MMYAPRQPYVSISNRNNGGHMNIAKKRKQHQNKIRNKSILLKCIDI